MAAAGKGAKGRGSLREQHAAAATSDRHRRRRRLAPPSLDPRPAESVLSRGEKLVAIAQAKHGGRTLVHGSVLERRPPDELVQVAETLLGEPWQSDGLAGAGHTLAPEMIWNRVLAGLETSLRAIAAD